MGITLDNFIQDLCIEQLMKSPVGDKLQLAVHTLETIQAHFCALSDKQNELDITGMKAVTVLTFAMLKKLGGGKKTSELTNDDWKDIAKVVSDYAVLADDRLYSVFVFRIFERYLLGSAKMIENIASADTSDSIRGLAEDLHRKSELFESDKISETAYIEDCLWICLEGMIKLTASTAFLSGSKEVSGLVQALSIYGFEYGRMILYKKEQEMIKEYLEGQHQLDDELEKKYTEFLSELQEQAAEFRVLIDNAFAADFRETYLNSAKLALYAGVPESEVLKTDEDTDDFFLN